MEPTLTTPTAMPPTPPTSTIEPAARVAGIPAPKAPARRAVYPKRGTPLTAYQLLVPTEITMLSDVKVYAHPGMWVIANGEHVVDVVPENLFAARFEPAASDSLVIGGEHRAKLENALGLGATNSPRDLTVAVERLARLSIGEIPVDFSAGQWDVLAHRAKKRGITTDALVRQLVDRITSEIWDV